tara:strand:+ start:1048 stop:1572 length:525 start_codon:yes stop_codon:yes gene_type:complete
MAGTLIVSNIEAQNYKFDSDTTGMTIGSGGRILTPARPAFLAYDSSSGWRDYNAHGGAADMVWGATRFNIGGHFNTSTGKFTVPIAGIYRFHCWAYVSLAAHKNYLYLNKNGSQLQSTLMDNDGDNETAQVSGLVQCAVNDLIHMQYQCTTDTSNNVYSGASEQWTGFEGYLIG